MQGTIHGIRPGLPLASAGAGGVNLITLIVHAAKRDRKKTWGRLPGIDAAPSVALAHVSPAARAFVGGIERAQQITKSEPEHGTNLFRPRIRSALVHLLRRASPTCRPLFARIMLTQRDTQDAGAQAVVFFAGVPSG